MQFVTLAALEQYTDVSNYPEGLPERVIDWVNDYIQRYCGRTFDLQHYRIWGTAHDCGELILPTYPIQAVYRLAGGKRAVMSLTRAANLVYATVDVESGRLRIGYKPPDGAATHVVYTLEDYATLTALAAAINTDLSPTIAAAATDEDEPLALMTGSYPMMTTAALYGPSQALPYLHIDYESGVIALPGRFTGEYYANLFAGYGACPPALEAIAVEMAAAVLQARARDVSVIEEQIGDYRVKFRDDPVVQQSVVSRFSDRLNEWKAARI